MADSAGNGDTPLSIASSIAGILTFLAAIAAAAWVRLKFVHDAEREIFAAVDRFEEMMLQNTWMGTLLDKQYAAGSEWVKLLDVYGPIYASTEAAAMIREIHQTLGNVFLVQPPPRTFLAEFRAWRVLEEQDKIHFRSWIRETQLNYCELVRSTRSRRIQWLRVRTRVLELLEQLERGQSQTMILLLSMLHIKQSESDIRNANQQKTIYQMNRTMRKMMVMMDMMEKRSRNTENSGSGDSVPSESVGTGAADSTHDAAVSDSEPEPRPDQEHLTPTDGNTPTERT